MYVNGKYQCCEGILFTGFNSGIQVLVSVLELTLVCFLESTQELNWVIQLIFLLNLELKLEP